MNVLLDTNTLLRMAEPRHPMRDVALQAAASLLGSGETLCLVAQNLYEFWVVSTRPLELNGLGLSAAQAELELTKIKNQFPLHDDTPAVRAAWEQLVVKYQVVGKNAHDTRLVAAMIVHGIERILTFNSTHFQRYQEIDVVSPDKVVPSI